MSFLNNLHYQITHFLKSKKHAAGVIAFCNDKVLLIKDEKGRWKIPGGGVERGESIINAAKREFIEETAKTNFKIKGLFSVLEFKRILGNYYAFTFIASVNSTKLNKQKVLCRSITDVAFFTKQQVKNLKPNKVRNKVIKTQILKAFSYNPKTYPMYIKKGLFK